MIATIQDPNHYGARTVRGADVMDIARTQFGRRGRNVAIRAERHGVWAVVVQLGAGCEGVIGRIHPIGR